MTKKSLLRHSGAGFLPWETAHTMALVRSGGDKGSFRQCLWEAALFWKAFWQNESWKTLAIPFLGFWCKLKFCQRLRDLGSKMIIPELLKIAKYWQWLIKHYSHTTEYYHADTTKKIFIIIWNSANWKKVTIITYATYKCYSDHSACIGK